MAGFCWLLSLPGGATVKWHVKNLFLKLSAGTRKHAVDRARLLGLVGT